MAALGATGWFSLGEEEQQRDTIGVSWDIQAIDLAFWDQMIVNLDIIWVLYGYTIFRKYLKLMEIQSNHLGLDIWKPGKDFLKIDGRGAASRVELHDYRATPWIKSNKPINRHIFPSHAALQSSPAGAAGATGAATAATATAARGGDGGAGGGGGISWKGKASRYGNHVVIYRWLFIVNLGSLTWFYKWGLNHLNPGVISITPY